MTAVARTPAEWFAAGETVYHEFLAALGRYGVSVDPDLRLVEGDAPTPYYEHASKSVSLGMPDPATVKGRLYWLFAARMWGLAGVDEAIDALADHLPWLVAHEVTHHLRHHYGAPSHNDFVEEQVANAVAIAFLEEHPVHRATLPRLETHARRAAETLRQSAPEALTHLAGYRMGVGEVLVAEKRLGRDRLAELEAVADALGARLDYLLADADAVPDAVYASADAGLEETEAYFNTRYMASLAEYFVFGNDWLAAYLEQDDRPTLAEALEAYVLTDDWERTRRREILLLLVSALRHPDDAVAAAAARTLADEAAAEAVPSLRAALADERPHVRAEAAAALVRFRGPEAEPGRAELVSLLGDPRPDARRAAVEAAETVRDIAFLPPLLAAAERGTTAERAAALRALARLPEAPGVTDLAVAVLAEPDEELRDAAAAILRAAGEHAIPTLKRVAGPLEARADATRLLHFLGDTRAEDAVDDLLGEIAARSAALRRPNREDDVGRLLATAIGEERDRLARLGLVLAAERGKDDEVERLLEGTLAAEPSVRETAFELARELAMPRFRPVVERLLAEPGEDGGPEALRKYPGPLLRELADSPSESRPEGGAILTTVEEILFLKSVPLFATVPVRELRALAEDVMTERYRQGDQIFDAGDPSDALYVVVDGQVAIEVGEEELSLGPRQAFGELGALSGRPRPHRAVALSDTTLLALARDSLLRTGRRHPQILIEIVRVLDERLQRQQAPGNPADG